MFFEPHCANVDGKTRMFLFVFRFLFASVEVLPPPESLRLADVSARYSEHLALLAEVFLF